MKEKKSNPFPTSHWECLKCKNRGAETGKIRVTGDGASRYVNLQNHKFGYIACNKCGYTEFYLNKEKDKGWKTALDVLTN
tara:strand:+ start:5079 stop:5318 length:240 start_codon:yes stop_codon:yes gene_type:complete